MSTCKITYNGNEISSVDETAPVSVAYNSATIATLNDGDTKTLGCHGKVMVSDVVVGGKTLNCNGKLMQGDIVVELVGSTTSGETWYFNETVSYPGKIDVLSGITTNGTHYQWFKVWSSFYLGKPAITCYPNEYPETDGSNHIYAQKDGGWKNAAYRTIILDEPATGDLLAFLEANATKLS